MTVVARNIGRLGNNMLQIAAAIGYARKYGYDWAADSSRGVSEPYSAIHEVFPHLPKAQPNGVRYHEHQNKFCKLHNTHLDQCHFNYHPIPDMGPNLILTGFFQSYKYFEGAEEEIKKVFALPHWAEYENYVSCHIRRGDYVQHSGSFPPITSSYIDKAIIKIHELDKPDSGKVIFFSDDIKWAKENHSGPNSEFSEGRTERQDLEIMASCRHHVIANSTFSWFAAYLGHNPNRIIVTPSAKRGSWFGLQNGVQQDVVDLLPPEWIQIDRV